MNVGKRTAARAEDNRVGGFVCGPGHNIGDYLTGIAGKVIVVATASNENGS